LIFNSEKMMSVWTAFDPPALHKITDKIYLSNELGAQDFKMLKDRNVTHILVAGNFLQQKFPGHFKYLQLPINDAASQDLSLYFEEAIKFIDEAEKVLVHCYAGVSRSSSMVIAYLMYKYKWTYTEAYTHVKKKRTVINPNKGFVSQLQELEKFFALGDLDWSKFTTKLAQTTSLLLNDDPPSQNNIP